jgi:hypothetical protein
MWYLNNQVILLHHLLQRRNARTSTEPISPALDVLAVARALRLFQMNIACQVKPADVHDLPKWVQTHSTKFRKEVNLQTREVQYFLARQWADPRTNGNIAEVLLQLGQLQCEPKYKVLDFSNQTRFPGIHESMPDNDFQGREDFGINTSEQDQSSGASTNYIGDALHPDLEVIHDQTSNPPSNTVDYDKMVSAQIQDAVTFVFSEIFLDDTSALVQKLALENDVVISRLLRMERLTRLSEALRDTHRRNIDKAEQLLVNRIKQRLQPDEASQRVANLDEDRGRTELSHDHEEFWERQE